MKKKYPCHFSFSDWLPSSLFFSSFCSPTFPCHFLSISLPLSLSWSVFLLPLTYCCSLFLFLLRRLHLLCSIGLPPFLLLPPLLRRGIVKLTSPLACPFRLRRAAPRCKENLRNKKGILLTCFKLVLVWAMTHHISPLIV